MSFRTFTIKVLVFINIYLLSFTRFGGRHSHQIFLLKLYNINIYITRKAIFYPDFNSDKGVINNKVYYTYKQLWSEKLSYQIKAWAKILFLMVDIIDDLPDNVGVSSIIKAI